LNRRSSLSSIPVTRRSSFERRLKAYCMAAGAAGVSALAMKSAAEAEVIYTPAQGHITFERWSKIDLNHDGIFDASFLLSSSNYKVIDRALIVRPSPGGGIIGYKGLFFPYASAFRGGVPIGPKAAFLSDEPFLCRTEIDHYNASFTFSAGAWRNSRGLYLGVKFLIGGETHYGWIRLSVSAPRKLEGIVTGYAYETIADQPILAGQTSRDWNESQGAAETEPADKAVLSLGRLALGSGR
jgi:hypothetical protein